MHGGMHGAAGNGYGFVFGSGNVEVSLCVCLVILLTTQTWLGRKDLSVLIYLLGIRFGRFEDPTGLLSGCFFFEEQEGQGAPTGLN